MSNAEVVKHFTTVSFKHGYLHHVCSGNLCGGVSTFRLCVFINAWRGLNVRLIKFPYRLQFKYYHDYVNRECTLCDMHGCMTEWGVITGVRTAVSVVRSPLTDVRMSQVQDKELQMLQTKVVVEETQTKY